MIYSNYTNKSGYNNFDSSILQLSFFKKLSIKIHIHSNLKTELQNFLNIVYFCD